MWNECIRCVYWQILPNAKMKRGLGILLTTIALIFTTKAKADTWFDPSWKIMLDSSDLVAIVQYTGHGKFRASAKILTVYKGRLKTADEIWISGFSNRYGPIDKMRKGDKYLVFLNFNQPDQKGIEYWNEEQKKKSRVKAFR